MKKKYIVPTLKMYIIKTNSMLAGSLDTLGDEITEGNVESEGKEDFDW